MPSFPPEGVKFYLPSLRKLSVAWISNMRQLFHLIDPPILETIDINGRYLGDWPESLSNRQSDINPWNVFETVRNVTMSFDNETLRSLLCFPCLTHLTLRSTLFDTMPFISLHPFISWQSFHEPERDRGTIDNTSSLKPPHLHTLHIEIDHDNYRQGPAIDLNVEFVPSLMALIRSRADCNLPLKVVTYKYLRCHIY